MGVNGWTIVAWWLGCFNERSFFKWSKKLLFSQLERGGRCSCVSQHAGQAGATHRQGSHDALLLLLSVSFFIESTKVSFALTLLCFKTAHRAAGL